MSSYPFYMLRSNESVHTISEIIQEQYKLTTTEVELKPIGLIKIIYSKKKETDRTLCVIDPAVYNTMKSNGFNIHPYIRNDYNTPKEDETRNLFIQLPPTPPYNRLSVCQKYINTRMNYLVLHGLWKDDDFKIDYPEKSREKDTHDGKSFIIFFGDDILEKIALTRIFINGSLWPNSNFRIKCFWARKSKKRLEKEGNRTPKVIKFTTSEIDPELSKSVLVKPIATKSGLKKSNVLDNLNAWNTPLKLNNVEEKDVEEES